MKINVSDLTREDMQKYKIEGYILFDVSLFIDDSLESKDLFLAKKDDLLFSSSSKVIALDDVKEDKIILNLFDENNSSYEEIFDKIGEYLCYEVTNKGEIKKISIRFRKSY